MKQLSKEQREILIKTANYMIDRIDTSDYSENIRQVATLALSCIDHEPVAWMVCGGRLYRDQPHVSIGSAEVAAKKRNDGSEVAPLYASPPAAQPVTVKLPERYELQETSRNPYQSYMQLEPDADGDWLKRDDVLAMLAGVGITIAEGGGG